MTTIAVDSESIAWDTQLTYGNEKMLAKARKVLVVDGVIFAMAGQYGLFDPLIKWWHDGADTKHAPRDQWDMLVITSPSKITLYSRNEPCGIPVVPPFALGSGDQFAIGRMDAPGTTAREAVVCAAKHDIYTGGSIRTLRFDKVWPKSRKRRKAK